jgi:hypothetical protein
VLPAIGAGALAGSAKAQEPENQGAQSLAEIVADMSRRLVEQTEKRCQAQSDWARQERCIRDLTAESQKLFRELEAAKKLAETMLKRWKLKKEAERSGYVWTSIDPSFGQFQWEPPLYPAEVTPPNYLPATNTPPETPWYTVTWGSSSDIQLNTTHGHTVALDT